MTTVLPVRQRHHQQLVIGNRAANPPRHGSEGRRRRAAARADGGAASSASAKSGISMAQAVHDAARATQSLAPAPPPARRRAFQDMRSGGRVVEGARLESEYTPKAYRGFESLPLRQHAMRHSSQTFT